MKHSPLQGLDKKLPTAEVPFFPSAPWYLGLRRRKSPEAELWCMIVDSSDVSAVLCRQTTVSSQSVRRTGQRCAGRRGRPCFLAYSLAVPVATRTFTALTRPARPPDKDPHARRKSGPDLRRVTPTGALSLGSVFLTYFRCYRPVSFVDEGVGRCLPGNSPSFSSTGPKGPGSWRSRTKP